MTKMEQKIEALLAQMTLDEKIGQISQVRHFDDMESDQDIATKFIGSVIHTQGPLPGNGAKEWQARFTELQKLALSTRLGIPLLFAVDAVHGQNTYESATIFPHNIGMGATGNADLVKRAAEITAIETQATGFSWAFSPCVAIPYNEKWGRVYEAFSESSELVTKLTIASVQGHQGDDLASPNTVMATAKHFLGDGATDYGVEGGKTTVSREELLERMLPPYKAAVDAGIGSVMASFNFFENVPMHAHKELLTGVLKGELGFDGILVSDWKAYSRFGGNAVINAGVDMLMATEGDFESFQDDVKAGVLSGEILMERLDDAVRRILRQKFRLGLFENPFPNAELIEKIGCSEHREVARQAVRESLVLLKNNEVLPLSKDAKKIVVVGEHADNTGLQSGGWTIDWGGRRDNYGGATSILTGIKQHATGEVIYDQDASQTHEDADVAILVVGETPYAEFFGDIGDHNTFSDEYSLTMNETHQAYINHYVKQGAPVVVIFISGRALVVTEQIEQSDAFVAAWLMGSEGNGVAEVLFGDYNFKGKLPHTWPRSVEDYNGKYGPNHWDENGNPLFPLGFGLEY